MVAWAAGPREAVLAETVVQTTRQRTAAQAGVPWISDGWEAYAEAIADLYCDPVPAAIPGHDWSILHRTPGVARTQAVKHRRGRRLVRIAVRATIGTMAGQPDTVHIERLNGVLRDRLACLTRTTHAFAKDPKLKTRRCGTTATRWPYSSTTGSSPNRRSACRWRPAAD